MNWPFPALRRVKVPPDKLTVPVPLPRPTAIQLFTLTLPELMFSVPFLPPPWPTNSSPPTFKAVAALKTTTVPMPLAFSPTTKLNCPPWVVARMPPLKLKFPTPPDPVANLAAVRLPPVMLAFPAPGSVPDKDLGGGSRNGSANCGWDCRGIDNGHIGPGGNGAKAPNKIQRPDGRPLGGRFYGMDLKSYTVRLSANLVV